MILISYPFVNTVITAAWICARLLVWKKERNVSWKREAQLLPVYLCIMMVGRYTMFPFDKENGVVQPLIFDVAKISQPQILWKPVINLLVRPQTRMAWVNLIGNFVMFIPIGIVWPGVFPKLNRHWKVFAAGIGYSVCIELFQLLFYTRVTDVDDVILNTLGYAVGYGIYLLVKMIFRK